MTFDEARGQVLLFGGAAAEPLGDLWSWDGTRWTCQAADGPPAREETCFVFDPVHACSVLFGGRAADGTLLGDTWKWDGNAWSRADVSGPSPRHRAAAAFERGSGCLLLHGGLGPQGETLGDTWAWDGCAWTRLAAGGALAGRVTDRMVYDEANGRMLLLVLAAGAPLSDGTRRTELWEWRGQGWQALGGSGPGIRADQDVASLGEDGGLFLFDGSERRGPTRTWLWRRGAWELRPGLTPGTRAGHALARDSRRDRIVLFGGLDGGEEFGDTWEWDGTRWRFVAPG